MPHVTAAGLALFFFRFSPAFWLIFVFSRRADTHSFLKAPFN
jgi:hypothetical protein